MDKKEMDTTLASTYEILKKIGRGGSGEVYLANHLRLGKKVVLKRYKGSVQKDLQYIRREVDILKELNHPQIPRVYDFLQESECLITVMDYVEGESLDRCLKKGERFSEKTVIKWAGELLEALVYLHSPIHGTPPKGYIHSDIKPGNLMKRYDGSISLIDFNIALAIGEETAVGYSPGYSSPEQCRYRYSGESRQEEKSQIESREPENTQGDSLTVKLADSKKSGGSKETSSRSGASKTAARTIRMIKPDVRSDIYSTGATLYHLLTGEKPDPDADKVKPISDPQYNPQLVRIIMRAIDPDPDKRYQTAREMLEDLRGMKQRDPRLKKRKTQNRIITALLGTLFCAGLASSFVGLKGMQTEERMKREEAELLREQEESLKLAGDAGNAYEKGDIRAALEAAVCAHSEHFDTFLPQTQAKISYALTQALGLYDLSDGYKTVTALTLPSQLLSVSLSEDGRYLACFYGFEIAVIDTRTYETIAVLPAEESALAEMEFLDPDHLIFAGRDGIEAYEISTGKTLWKGEKATAISLSADGSTAAALYKDDTKARLYRTDNGELITEVDFEGRHQWIPSNDRFLNPDAGLFELNPDGTFLAVSYEDGTMDVFDLEKDAIMTLGEEGGGYSGYQGGFCGDYLAFTMDKEGTGLFEVLDIRAQTFTGQLQSPYGFKVETEEDRILLNTANRLVRLDPETFEEEPAVKNVLTTIRSFASCGEHTLIWTADQLQVYDQEAQLIDEQVPGGTNEFLELGGEIAVLGNLYDPVIRILKFETCPEKRFASYPREYAHSETRVSADQEHFMLFSRYGFAIYDLNGEKVIEKELEEERDLYDIQFIRKDGMSYLERIYYDGSVTAYDAVTGEIAYEEQREAPEPSLYEEFTTSRYRIESVLHEAPKVYDLETGDFVCELQKEDNLIYITETGDYIAAQYLTTEGKQYGLLMDSGCEVIAKLPCLCDVYDGSFFFDYGRGTILRSGIYETKELKGLAEARLEELDAEASLS